MIFFFSTYLTYFVPSCEISQLVLMKQSLKSSKSANESRKRAPENASLSGFEFKLSRQQKRLGAVQLDRCH